MYFDVEVETSELNKVDTCIFLEPVPRTIWQTLVLGARVLLGTS